MKMLETNKEYFWDTYKDLDKRFKLNKDYSYKYLVNFSQIKNEPIHRWFYYQEGYSPRLVENIFEHLKLSGKNIFIFDPFAGSGTTLLTAKHLKKKSSGFEINPFSAFMINVKTRNYTLSELEQVRKFRAPSYKRIPGVYRKYELQIIRNLFDRAKLEKIELLKKKIEGVYDRKVRDLLYAALLCILEDVSNYRKGGNGLKRKRENKNLDPFLEFERKRSQMVDDLSKETHGPEPKVINDSCLNMSKYDLKRIDISIFSPPYANCFDPFEVYKIELWLGEFVSSYSELRAKRRAALTSNLNADINKDISHFHRTETLTNIIEYLSKKDLWDKRIPKMLDTYFYDMYVLLKTLYNSTKQGGFCIIVVGNSSYGNLAVPTDLLLAEMGEKAGFVAQEIIEARKNETSSQQHAKLGKLVEYIRESLVVLKK
jgi:DNA modification methylase